MIKRIVRLSFQPEKVEDFLNIFRQHRELIANFPGCIALELCNDTSQKNVFYTVSLWKSEQDLENYRNSDLFLTTWASTKILFNDKPLAYSLSTFDVVKSIS